MRSSASIPSCFRWRPASSLNQDSIWLEEPQWIWVGPLFNPPPQMQSRFTRQLWCNLFSISELLLQFFVFSFSFRVNVQTYLAEKLLFLTEYATIRITKRVIGPPYVAVAVLNVSCVSTKSYVWHSSAHQQSSTGDRNQVLLRNLNWQETSVD